MLLLASFPSLSVHVIIFSFSLIFLLNSAKSKSFYLIFSIFFLSHITVLASVVITLCFLFLGVFCHFLWLLFCLLAKFVQTYIVHYSWHVFNLLVYSSDALRIVVTSLWNFSYSAFFLQACHLGLDFSTPEDINFLWFPSPSFTGNLTLMSPRLDFWITSSSVSPDCPVCSGLTSTLQHNDV